MKRNYLLANATEQEKIMEKYKVSNLKHINDFRTN